MNQEGTIITFYSYKGGVGRSMALANVGVLLSQWGYRILMVDWDLEAPGLEVFFKDYIDVDKLKYQKGIIDLLNSLYKGNDSKNWRKYRVKIPLKNQTGQLDIITAGVRDDNYFERVRKIDFPKLYQDNYAGDFIENLRLEWKNEYDFILIDSRTGITDIGGICTIQLPEIVVLLFTATEQSLNGILKVGSQINQSLKKLPIDRFDILTLPIPTRFEIQTEFQIGKQWLDRYATELSPLVEDWLPENFQNFQNFREFIEGTKIPYIPYFSFGEKLPVIEQGTSDPAGLGYAYENLSALLAHRLADIEDYFSEREKYIEDVNKTRRRLKLFMSYSYANEEIIRECLMTLDLPFSFEILNAKIFDLNQGISWGKLIERQISECDLFISFVSEIYAESNSTILQLQHATKYNRPILFVRISKNESIKMKALARLNELIVNEINIFNRSKGLNVTLFNQTMTVIGKKILSD